jgi:N-methylhydantoinase B
VLTEDAWLTVRSSDRFARPPRGVEGGLPGRRGSWTVVHADGSAEELPPKRTNHYVHAGETLVFVNAGGGGLGDPHERDAAAVLEDVAKGIVTEAHAHDAYGVDVTAGGRTSRGDAS